MICIELKSHKRKSIRIPEYDYSKEGFYFVTVCTQNRKKILSKISEDIFNIEICRGRVPSLPAETLIGEQIRETIEYINNNYYNVDINKYVIMPNHIQVKNIAKNHIIKKSYGKEIIMNML